MDILDHLQLDVNAWYYKFNRTGLNLGSLSTRIHWDKIF